MDIGVLIYLFHGFMQAGKLLFVIIPRRTGVTLIHFTFRDIKSSRSDFVLLVGLIQSQKSMKEYLLGQRRFVAQIGPETQKFDYVRQT